MSSTRAAREGYRSDAQQFADQPDAPEGFVDKFMGIFDMWVELGYVPETSDDSLLFLDAEIAFDEFLESFGLSEQY